MQPQHNEENSTDKMENTLDFSSRPFPDLGHGGLAKGGTVAYFAGHKSGGSEELYCNDGRVETEPLQGHTNRPTTILRRGVHHEPSGFDFASLTAPGVDASHHIAVTGYFNGASNQSLFMSTVFDNSTSQFLAPQTNSTHGYDAFWAQQSSRLLGLENSQDVGADVGHYPLGILNRAAQGHSIVVGHEPLWLNQATQPLYGVADLENWQDEWTNGHLPKAVDSIDDIETIDGSTGNRYNTSSQDQYLPNNFSRLHSGSASQEGFNTDGLGYDYAATDILGNDQFPTEFVSPDLPAGLTVAPIVWYDFNTGATPLATNHPFQDPTTAPAAATHPAPQPPRFQCTNCTATFKRDGDRKRHNDSKHLATQGVHLCPIAGCPQSQGSGYSRGDKLTEHLWKKHGDLGYTKAV